VVGTLAPQPLSQLLVADLDLVAELVVLDLLAKVLVEREHDHLGSLALDSVAELGLLVRQAEGQCRSWHPGIVQGTSSPPVTSSIHSR